MPTLAPTPEHLTFALQALLTFAKAAEKSQTLKSEVAKGVESRGLELLQKIEREKMDPSKASVEMRKIVHEINASLPRHHAPYPPFASDFVENQVKNHIIAFELFLNHKLKAGTLTLEQERPLFSDSLILWRDVGGKLSTQSAMQGLTRLIMKANSYLSDNERFPIPDPTKY